MHFINLTPHQVDIYAGTNKIRAVPASGTVARLTETEIVTEHPETEIEITTVSIGYVVGLPATQPHTMLIVSMPLAMGLRASGQVRDDVVYPYGQVRDPEGRIIGCRGFAKIA